MQFGSVCLFGKWALVALLLFYEPSGSQLSKTRNKEHGRLHCAGSDAARGIWLISGCHFLLLLDSGALLIEPRSSPITLRLYLHSYSAYSPPPPKPPPTPALSPYSFTCTKRALLPLACACRLTHTHLNVPSASLTASFIFIVWSTRVRVAGLRGSPTSMQVVGPELWIGKARTRSAGASRRKEERKRTVVLHA